MGPQRLAHLGDLLEELRGLAGVLGAAAQLDVDRGHDAARPGRHHDDPVRQVHGLGDRVGDEDDGGARLGADAGQLGLHVLAGHLVEGAERLVHQQERGWKARARAMATRCCMPPDSSHGWWSANSGSLTSSSSSRHGPGAWPCPSPCSSSGQLDVLGHRAPLEQPRVLEGHAVVLVEAGLAGALAVDRERAEVGSVRLAMSRSRVLLPQPDGPISETNSPGSIRRSMPRARSPGSARPALNTLPTPPATTAAVTSPRRPAHASASFGRLRMSARSISAMRPATSEAEERRAEHGGEHLGRVAGGLARVLDDEPADAAPGAGGDLGDDGADDGRRRAPASAPARGRAPRRGSAA